MDKSFYTVSGNMNKIKIKGYGAIYNIHMLL